MSFHLTICLFPGSLDCICRRVLGSDGRRELLSADQSYDLITLEPPPPSAAGVVNLYSSDFYQIAAKRLSSDGLLAQWLPLPTQTDQDTRSLGRSFLDVFPYATLWSTELHEMMLAGSLSPIELDLAKIESRLAQPSIKKSLSEVGIYSPAALLANLSATANHHAIATTCDAIRLLLVQFEDAYLSESL